MVASIVTTATAIAAVDSQPTAHKGRGRVNWPMTLGCIAMVIMMTITDDAVDDCAPEQSLDRVDMDEIDADADQRSAAIGGAE
jgi:hypothetical protein